MVATRTASVVESALNFLRCLPCLNVGQQHNPVVGCLGRVANSTDMNGHWNSYYFSSKYKNGYFDLRGKFTFLRCNCHFISFH